MTDLTPEGGLSAVPQATSEAAAALASLQQPAQAAADAIDKAFVRAGASLTTTLGKAAADGKVSLGELASAVIQAVDAAAGKGAGGSLAGALGSLLGSVFGGARADGGPVAPGGAYLVGERGPEVFRPAAAGSIDAAPAAGGVTVNLTLPAGTDAAGLVRSEAQVAQALARAVALGRR